MAAAHKGNNNRGAAKQAPAKGKTLAKTPLAKLSATTAAAAATTAAAARDGATLPPRRSPRRGDTADAASELELIAKMNAANAAEATTVELPAGTTNNRTSGGRAHGTKADAGAGASTAVAPGAEAATSTHAGGEAGASAQKGGGKKAVEEAAGSSASDSGEGMEAEVGANEGTAVTPPPKKAKHARKRKTASSLSAVALKAALTKAGATTVPASPPSIRHTLLKHRDVKIRGQIELSSAKPTAEFVQMIRNLLAEMQKTADGTRLEGVQSGLVIDPLALPSKVPSDITLIQRHVDLNNQSLRRYKPWGRNKETTETDDEGYASPTPRFSISISTNMEPETLVNTIRPWFQDSGGIQLEVDRRLIFQAKPAALLFRQLAKNSTATIHAEMKLLLEEARQRAQVLDSSGEFCSTPVPHFGVRAAIPKIAGQDTTKFQNNDRRENAHRRVLQFECSAEHVEQLQWLVEMAKEFSLVGKLWGKGAHLSNVPQDKEGRSLMHLSAMCELCDAQISHSKLWRPAGLVGVLDVNVQFDIVMPGASRPTKVGARAILLGWPMFADGIPVFREVHQQGPGADVDVAIPNCEAAVKLLAQINKNPAVFFAESVLPKMGVPESWSQAFVNGLFSSTFVLSMHKHKWNEETRTMRSPDDGQEKLDEAIRGQAWAREALALPLSSNDQEQEFLPVESLVQVQDDKSTTTLNTKNRRGGGAKRVAGSASYKGDKGAPTLILGRKAGPASTARKGSNEGSEDDLSVMSDVTTMTDKSIQREELAELRKIRDLMSKGQLVDVTALDMDKLAMESGDEGDSLSGSGRTRAGESADEEDEAIDEEDHEDYGEEDEEEEEDETSGTRAEGVNKVYGSSSDETGKGGGSAGESATQLSQKGSSPAPSDGVNADDQMATGDG